MIIASVLKSSAFTTIIVKDSISTNTTWTCDNQYQLQGYVYVTAGATLTINPGVIIRGDKDTKGTLIVERGAKIMAMGTATSPIVFTSNQPAGTRTFGDWGGVILCGKSPVNWNAGEGQVEGGPRSFYGGTDPHDNSGEMHYVRIEFGGVAFSPNNEVNSLTLCGVGDATQIDHIQCSYNGDDAVEFFGGTVNLKYFVTLRTWDDDYDQDNGFQGKVQFGVAVRDNVADVSGSKGFEADSYQSGTYSGIPYDGSKVTKPIFSNMTLIGPVVNPGATSTDPNFVAGVHLRRGNATSLLNSVIAGWPAGLLIDESSSSYGSTVANIGSNELQFRNNIICGTSNLTFNKDAVFVFNGARSLTPTTSNSDTTATGTNWATLAGASNPGPISFIYNPAYKNHMYATEQGSVLLGNPFNLTNPNLVPNSTSPICFNSAHPFNPLHALNSDTSGGYVNYNMPTAAPDFTTSKASDAFFTRVNYIGAFAGTGATSDNWMKGWTEFDPNNVDYEVTCYTAPNAVPTANTDNFEGVSVYPNPANAGATVKAHFNVMGMVSVTIMDMTGKMVKEIFNGKMASGNHLFNFSTSDLSNGNYIIVVNEGKNIMSAKFNVAK